MAKKVEPTVGKAYNSELTMEPMVPWSELYKAFLILNRFLGFSKMSSGYMHVKFDKPSVVFSQGGEPKFEIVVEFGGYDIADWNRHQVFPARGVFDSELAAFNYCREKIKQAWTDCKMDWAEETASMPTENPSPVFPNMPSVLDADFVPAENQY